MIKYILVGGYVHKAPDGGRAFCEELIKDIDKKQVKILDCMFARPEDTWEEKLKLDNNLFSQFIKDFELELANPLRFIEQIKNSDILYFRGGIPRDLISVLNTTGDWLKELDGKVLVGTSGGADTICKYYGVGKTCNIGEGLGLLSIKFIPHWLSNYDEGLNIDWYELKDKLKEYKEDLPIYTLAEGEFKIFNK